MTEEKTLRSLYLPGTPNFAGAQKKKNVITTSPTSRSTASITPAPRSVRFLTSDVFTQIEKVLRIKKPLVRAAF
jgi:hypothetical protein